MNNNTQKYPQVKIFNPSLKDFTVTYDINEDKNPVSYTIHAQEAESFPEPVAAHIKEQLSKELCFQRGWNGSNFEDTKRAIEKEIEFKVEI